MRTATVANTLSPQWKRDPFYFPVTVSAYVGLHSLRNPLCVIVVHTVQSNSLLFYMRSTYPWPRCCIVDVKYTSGTGSSKLIFNDVHGVLLTATLAPRLLLQAGANNVRVQPAAAAAEDILLLALTSSINMQQQQQRSKQSNIAVSRLRWQQQQQQR
jgi:hypothetical protein